MPTMPKLFAAVLLAVLGYFAADRIGGHLPPETQQGMLRPMSVIFGIFIGWRFLGRRVGRGFNSGIGMGLSAGIALVLVGLFYFAGVEMLRRAMRMAYGGNPFEALQDMIQIAFGYTIYLANADVLAVLIGGSIGVGLVVEAVAKRWS